jgi:hypothetical protein
MSAPVSCFEQPAKLTVNVLVGVSTNVSLRSLNVTNDLSRLVHVALLVELDLVLWVHLLLVLTSEGRESLFDVLGVKNAVVLNGLNTVLVVVNVTLLIDSLGNLGVLLGTDVLLDDLGCDFGANLGRVTLVGLLQESLDGLHCVV